MKLWPLVGGLIAVALFAFLVVSRPSAEATSSQPAVAAPLPANAQRAVFAGGCFWSMEKAFEHVPGVASAMSGFAGGRNASPTYADVVTGETGHAEAVEVVYDPAKVSYEQLLYVYWRNIDPLRLNAQFCDRGTQYRTAIFVMDEAQLKLAQDSKKALDGSGRFDKPIVTEIVSGAKFYAAEGYHQDYAENNSGRYEWYRMGCGQDARLKELWGDEAGGARGHS